MKFKSSKSIFCVKVFSFFFLLRFEYVHSESFCGNGFFLFTGFKMENYIQSNPFESIKAIKNTFFFRKSRWNRLICDAINILLDKTDKSSTEPNRADEQQQRKKKSAEIIADFSVANSFVYRLINMHAINTFKCINTCVWSWLRQKQAQQRKKSYKLLKFNKSTWNVTHILHITSVSRRCACFFLFPCRCRSRYSCNLFFRDFIR